MIDLFYINIHYQYHPFLLELRIVSFSPPRLFLEFADRVFSKVELYTSPSYCPKSDGDL